MNGSVIICIEAIISIGEYSLSDLHGRTPHPILSLLYNVLFNLSSIQFVNFTLSMDGDLGWSIVYLRRFYFIRFLFTFYIIGLYCLFAIPKCVHINIILIFNFQQWPQHTALWPYYESVSKSIIKKCIRLSSVLQFHLGFMIVLISIVEFLLLLLFFIYPCMYLLVAFQKFLFYLWSVILKHIHNQNKKTNTNKTIYTYCYIHINTRACSYISNTL